MDPSEFLKPKIILFLIPFIILLVVATFYIASHKKFPLQEKIESFQISEFDCNGKKGYRDNSIAIFIDKETYSQIKFEIDRFASDIEKDLCTKVILYTFVNSTTKPEEIRNIIIRDYKERKLMGIILIGDIPYVYVEHKPAEQDWPGIEYYSNLEGEFLDSDNNNKFDFFPLKRNIWIGIILPPNFKEDRNKGITLLKEYFNRNHDYRTGNLKYEEKLLVFPQIQIFDLKKDKNYIESSLRDSLNGIWTKWSENFNILYSNDPNELDNQFLEELKKPYEVVLVNAHGSPTWHMNNINYENIKEIRPSPLFYIMVSCSVGKFDKPNYLAGSYLFYGNGLVVLAQPHTFNICPTYGMEMLRLVGKGVLWGEASSMACADFQFYVFGDPTLRVRIDIPDIKIEFTRELDFGIIKKGSGWKYLNISIKNLGKDDLIIENIYAENFGFYAETPKIVKHGEEYTIKIGANDFNERCNIGEQKREIIIETNRPFDPFIRILAKLYVEPMKLKVDLNSCNQNARLCHVLSLDPACRSAIGNKFCQPCSKCVNVTFWETDKDLKELRNPKNVDCSTPYNGNSEWFYVQVTCCHLVIE